MTAKKRISMSDNVLLDVNTRVLMKMDWDEDVAVGDGANDDSDGEVLWG